MKNNLRKTILNFFIIILLFGIGYIVGGICSKNDYKESTIVTDTIFLNTINDTIIKEKPYHVKETIIDTITIDTNIHDTIYLPRIQKEYSDSLWNIWVSGVEPLSLDSVKLFIPKQTEVIHKKEVVNVIDKKPHIFGGFGFYSICGGIASDVLVSTQLGNKWIIGANMGVYKDKLTYGLSVQYKIF